MRKQKLEGKKKQLLRPLFAIECGRRKKKNFSPLSPLQPPGLSVQPPEHTHRLSSGSGSQGP